MKLSSKLAREVIEYHPSKLMSDDFRKSLEGQIEKQIEVAIKTESRTLQLLVEAGHVSPDRLERARHLAATLK